MIYKPIKIGSPKLQTAIKNAMKKQFGWSVDLATDVVRGLVNKYFSVLSPNLVVVVEYPYVDKVYRNSYYRYYAGKAERTARDCIRLSFLVDTRPSLANKEMKPELWENFYRGFMVLRPTELNVVGRNGISPMIYKDNSFVICKTNLPASVNGLKVNVEAFPASSQDVETMVCAETAVWALMEYFGNRYAEYTPVRPSHIINLLKSKSFERQLPSAGLTNDQICYLLKNLNFQPVMQAITDDADGYSLIGTFVESGIPTLLTANNLEDYDDEDNEDVCELIAHAVLCIGHENLSSEAIDDAVAETNDDGINIVDYDKIKKKFVFIDDNCPAYCMDYLDQPTDRYKGLGDKDDEEAKKERKSWLACKLRFAIIPLYEKILLMPGLVKIMANNFLQYLSIPAGTELTMRTFLASSRSYRDYVCRNNMPQKMKDTILKLYLPKFIWVVELSTREGLKHLYAEGLMIFDSTEPNFKNLSSLGIMYHKNIVAYKDEHQNLKIEKDVPEVQFECYRNNLR